MLTANMELPERILRDVRCLHDDLIEQLVFAAGLGADGCFIDGVNGCPGLGLDGVSRFIQALGDNNHLVEGAAAASEQLKLSDS